MSEARACKECGKMFTPKGREKYCPGPHYRPCPICGVSVLVKYLSDPPAKCDNCKGKKMKPVNKVKSLFDIDSNKSVEPVKVEPEIQPEIQSDHVANNVSEATTQSEVKPSYAVANKIPKKSRKQRSFETTTVDPTNSNIVDPEEFCNSLSGKHFKFNGPGPFGKYDFIPNHDYVLNLERKDGNYLATSSLDLTTGMKVTCYCMYSSQVSIGNRFMPLK